jgi:uncharacterized glyoxalase superfamily protein PhnB
VNDVLDRLVRDVRSDGASARGQGDAGTRSVVGWSPRRDDRLAGTRMKLGGTTPILRIFDEAKAREFYVGFLGFTVDWQHRFGENFPLYLQVSRDGCVLHLSEHYGDCAPGASVRVETAGIDELCRELLAREYRYAKPQVEEAPWGDRLLSIADPFGNRLVFFERLSTGAPA